jgi:sugar transferase (PEP-CTERM/EpsH1 system associated)
MGAVAPAAEERMTSDATNPRRMSARILHVVDSLNSGGTELVSAALIERTGGSFEHAVCFFRGSGPAENGVASLKVPVTFLGKRDGHDWTLALRIARLCRRLRPQVVHARNWGTMDAVIGARLAGVPVVVQSEHGRDMSDLDGLHPRRIRVRRLLAPFIDVHVVVSEHLQRWLVECVRVAPEKVRVVRNGVDAARFMPLVERDRVREEEGYGRTDHVFGAVGRLTPVKDHRTLLEAFHAVSMRRPECRLVLVGDGAERPLLEEQVRQRGLADRVRIVGHRVDVTRWLGMMDVFVHPSLMEGMSNAVLEAMAVGLPVVATAVGGNPEIVEHGVGGSLVPPSSPSALADAMLSYCGDDRMRMAHGAAARERVEKDFPLMKMVAGYTAVYRDALARRGRGIEFPAGGMIDP